MGHQGAVWTRTAKGRERWKTLAEGYFLQWKDTASNRTEHINTVYVYKHTYTKCTEMSYVAAVLISYLFCFMQ